MGAYTGLTASVKIGPAITAETVGYISGVDLNLEKDIIEIIKFGAQYKEKVPAIKDWSASVDGTLAIAEGNTQKEIYDAFESGDPITIGVYLDDDDYFEGTCFVQSFKISAAPDDKISLTAELAGSGAVILTLAGLISLVDANISGVAQVGQVLSGSVNPSGATVTHRWLISNTVGGVYTAISAATASSYTIVIGDLGKFIKYEATATGEFGGQVVSAPTSVIIAA